MFDYKLLSALAAVVEQAGFERGAQVLGVSQSAISQRIKLLEAFKHRCSWHIVAVPHALGCFPGCEQLCLCEPADGFDALAQVGPIGVWIGCTWKVSGHANNGNVVRYV